MKEVLSKYVPVASLDELVYLLEKYPCRLKIVKQRKTKHGDFRQLADGRQLISINNDLNRYRFLLTLVHEIAHLATFQKYGRVRPHGKEWKQTFQHLMLPFLNTRVFPDDLIRALANYFKNPRASTDTDINLSLALKQYDEEDGKNFIFEIPDKSKFIFEDRIFIKGSRRRTRFGCIEIASGKRYLFHQNAKVEII